MFGLTLGLLAEPASASPLELRVLTIADELLPAPGLSEEQRPTTPIEFITPAELPAPEVPERITFRTEYPTLEFGEVKALILKQESRRWIGSEAGSIEWYRLGSLDSSAPPLPGWARSFGRHASWRTAEPAGVSAETPYLNRAQSVWATGDPDTKHASGEFLFRARLELEEERAVSFARLHFFVCGKAIDIRLNDLPIQVKSEGAGGVWTADVSRLIESGPNILAFHLRTREGGASSPPSFAFSLEYGLSENIGAPGDPAFQQAVLHTRQGDRVRGRVLTFNPVSILIQTPYGRYGADWDQVESVLFPQGWYEPPPRKSPPLRRLIRFFGFEDIAREDEAPSAPPLGIPISAPGNLSEGGVLLRDGRCLTEELIGVEDGNVKLRHRDTHGRVVVDRADIAAIYPPPPESLRFQRPAREFEILDCRLKTTRGEVFSGILRQVNSRGIVLEHPGDGILSFPPDRVVWIWFPLHRDRVAHAGEKGPPEAAPARSGTSIAILAIPSPSRPIDPGTLELHREIQQAAFLAGLECHYPTPESILDPARLDVRNYPLVAIADSEGAYPDTILEEGDARAAILNYVEEGGTLLLYSYRGALLSPRSLQGNAASDAGDRPSPLLQALQLRPLTPGESSRSPLKPFERPPNLPVTLQMKRLTPAPRGFRSFPAWIDAPDLASASFAPLVSESGTDEALYQLVNSAGAVYGPALLAVGRGQGRVLIIDRWLWEASIEGRPFTQVVLPQLLDWAFRIQ